MNTLLRCTKYLLIFCISAMEGLDIPTLLSLVGILKETYTFSLERDLSKHPLSLSGSLHGLWASAHRQETHAVSPKSWGCKIALEVYKLSLEIEGRDVQTWSWAPVKNQYISFPSLPFKNRELGTFFSLATLPFLQCYYLLKKIPVFERSLIFFDATDSVELLVVDILSHLKLLFPWLWSYGRNK